MQEEKAEMNFYTKCDNLDKNGSKKRIKNEQIYKRDTITDFHSVTEGSYGGMFFVVSKCLEKVQSPQSLFGPEEVKAGFLHVHLKDNASTQSSIKGKAERTETSRHDPSALTTSSSISVCSLKALGPD